MKTTVTTSRIIFRGFAIAVLGLHAVCECEAQSAYIPPEGLVAISLQTNREAVSVTVIVDLPNPCHSVRTWGQPLRIGNNIYLDAQFWAFPLICTPVVIPVSTQFNLGTLPPGDYTFTFQAWGTTVKSQPFTVPLRLSIPAAQTDSQIHLCWNTAANAWYRVESCSTLAPNDRAGITAWLPGTGNPFCTNKAILASQPQSLFRVASTNAPPPP